MNFFQQNLDLVGHFEKYSSMHKAKNIFRTCTISAVFHAYKAGLKLYVSLKRG